MFVHFIRIVISIIKIIPTSLCRVFWFVRNFVEFEMPILKLDFLINFFNCKTKNVVISAVKRDPALFCLLQTAYVIHPAVLMLCRDGDRGRQGVRRLDRVGPADGGTGQRGSARPGRHVRRMFAGRAPVPRVRLDRPAIPAAHHHTGSTVLPRLARRQAQPGPAGVPGTVALSEAGSRIGERDKARRHVSRNSRDYFQDRGRRRYRRAAGAEGSLW